MDREGILTMKRRCSARNPDQMIHGNVSETSLLERLQHLEAIEDDDPDDVNVTQLRRQVKYQVHHTDQAL